MLQAAGGRPGKADENIYQYWDSAVWNLQALRAGFIADMELHGGIGSVTGANGSENLNVCAIDVLLHDVEAAEVRLRTAHIDEKFLPDVAAFALASECWRLRRAISRPPRSRWMFCRRPTPIRSSPLASTPMICYAAPIYEMAGSAGERRRRHWPPWER